jgi:predicted kinase
MHKSKLFLILLDGPMGSGKTTVAKLLHAKLKRTAHLGLDRIKWFISDFKRCPADNEIVRNVVVAMAKEYLKEGISVIIEQGMRKDSIEALKKTAKKYHAKCLVYQLDAPKNLLLARVHERPRLPGKPRISNARIERNYRAHLEHKYKGAVVLDVAKLSARQVAGRILSDLKR